MRSRVIPRCARTLRGRGAYAPPRLSARASLLLPRPRPVCGAALFALTAYPHFVRACAGAVHSHRLAYRLGLRFFDTAKACDWSCIVCAHGVSSLRSGLRGRGACAPPRLPARLRFLFITGVVQGAALFELTGYSSLTLGPSVGALSRFAYRLKLRFFFQTELRQLQALAVSKKRSPSR